MGDLGFGDQYLFGLSFDSSATLVVNTVPEPGTISGVALVGIIGLCLKRKRKAFQNV